MCGPIHTSLRRRIVHFLGIGALLFVVDRFVVGDSFEAETARPTVSDATRARLRAGWLRAVGRDPTPAEWDRVIEAEVDDELLLGEARRRGFHRSDALIRRRLARNVVFASEHPADSDASVSEAFAIGLDETDLVVRRRLIQKMKLLAFEPGVPSESALSDYLLRHADRFERGERVDLQHIFFSRDRRDDPERDAAAALAQLDRSSAVRPPSLGDPFIHGYETGLVSKSDLAMRFGNPFALSVFGAEAGGWLGPIASSFGSHLVWVRTRRAARVPPLEVVRAEVTEALLFERSQIALRDLIDGLRRKTGSMHVVR